MISDQVEVLEKRLSEPTSSAIETLARWPGDIVILGVGGKMGPTLARMVVRASQEAGTPRRVFGVSRFSDQQLPARLQACGVIPWPADLLETPEPALPEAPLVLYLAGRKFGSTGQEPLTWAMNALVPARVAARYRSSRIVAFSSGNVYGPVPVVTGGSRETDQLNPVGEYAMSCVARERIFQYASTTHGTPTCLIRLNYACELRYGVLVDLALAVHQGKPVCLENGAFNVIWQADANASAIQALDWCESPARIINVTGPETLSVRTVAEEFSRLFQKEQVLSSRSGERVLGSLDREPVPGSPCSKVVFEGREKSDALLNNPAEFLRCSGYPRISPWELIEEIANWIKQEGPLLGKPTHFENRDGKF